MEFDFPFARFGMERLVADGKLEPVENLSDRLKKDGTNVYRMLRPFEIMPAYVGDFLIVPRGMTPPTSLTRGCQYDEATGQMILASRSGGCSMSLSDVLVR
jgi:hypothetical protein